MFFNIVLNEDIDEFETPSLIPSLCNLSYLYNILGICNISSLILSGQQFGFYKESSSSVGSDDIHLTSIGSGRKKGKKESLSAYGKKRKSDFGKT